MISPNKQAIAYIVIATCYSILTACSDNKTQVSPPKPVKSFTIGQDSLTISGEFSGDIHAQFESALAFRVAGKITQRFVDMGDHVAKGQKLAQIDSRDYQLAKDASESALNTARANYNNMQVDFKRYDDLHGKGYISSAEFEKFKVSLNAAESQLKQAESQANLEKNRLNDGFLRADHDGTITARFADIGEVVNIGQPIFAFAQDGPREIEVALPESQIKGVRSARASISLWVNNDVRYPATLRELSSAADPITRTFKARYRINASPKDLILGQSATLFLDLPLGKVASATIPSTAVFGKNDQSFVWVYQPKTETIEALPIKIIGTNQTEVVVMGLNIGTQIVATGVHTLTPGQKVKLLTTSNQ